MVLNMIFKSQLARKQNFGSVLMLSQSELLNYKNYELKVIIPRIENILL